MKRNDYRMVVHPIGMARRKTRKSKVRKMEQTIKLKWDEAGNSDDPYHDSVFIDTAQCASIINRKLVRQGQMFRIKNMKVYTNDTSPNCTVKVGVIPQSWPTFNAYRKARGLWHKMNAMALDNASQGLYPKYHDFKVYMNSNHYSENTDTGADENLTPVDFDDNAAPTGEWVYSQFSDSGSTSDQYVAWMLGDHSGSTGSWAGVGLIQAYGESRALPQVDATVTDGLHPASVENSPWVRLFGDDNQTVDVINRLEGDNDTPPYDRANYPGGGSNMPTGKCVAFTRLQTLNQTFGTSLVSLPSFDAPLGLIRIEIDAETSTASMQPVHITFDYEILGDM